MSDGFPMSVIVTGFFVTSFAYLLCFCCCIIQFFIRRSRAMRRRNAAILTGVQPGNTQERQKNDTLKKKLMRQFEEFKKMGRLSLHGHPQIETTCPICFDDYKGDPNEIFIGYIKKCEHYFHFECIWEWLEQKSSCPLCREEVLLKEEDIRGLALSEILNNRTQQATPQQQVTEVTSQPVEETRQPKEATPRSKEDKKKRKTSKAASERTQKVSVISVSIPSDNSDHGDGSDYEEARQSGVFPSSSGVVNEGYTPTEPDDEPVVSIHQVDEVNSRNQHNTSHMLVYNVRVTTRDQENV